MNRSPDDEAYYQILHQAPGVYDTMWDDKNIFIIFSIYIDAVFAQQINDIHNMWKANKCLLHHADLLKKFTQLYGKGMKLKLSTNLPFNMVITQHMVTSF